MNDLGFIRVMYLTLTAILDKINHNLYDIFIDGDVSMREKLGIKAEI